MNRRSRFSIVLGGAATLLLAVGHFSPASANNMTISFSNGQVQGRWIDDVDKVCAQNETNQSVDVYTQLLRPDGTVRATAVDDTANNNQRVCSPNLSIAEDQWGWRIRLVFGSQVKVSEPFYT